MSYSQKKKEFAAHFESELFNNPELRFLMYEIFVFGSAYIVGGYLRDFLMSKPSRDIDIIVDIDGDKLLEILRVSNISYIINRHGGIKVSIKDINVDIWSIENNWAFKNELVKLNDKDKLHCIVKGCFYNFDALAVNIHTLKMNTRYFLEFMKEKKLDILQKSSIYKNLNPTIEANILRAFYLRKVYKVEFSSDTKRYLVNKIGDIKDQQLSPLNQLKNTMDKYVKYNKHLNLEDIEQNIRELYNGNIFDGQTYLEL